MEQRSAEWYEERRGKLTASPFIMILRGKKGAYLKSRETHMRQLLAERLTGEVAEGYESRAMMDGIEFEPMARMAYEARYGVPVMEVGFINHPAIKGLGASPDGLVGDDGGLEIKCPKSQTHLSVILDNEIDEAHMVQIQVALSCSGRGWWDYVNYDHRAPDNLSLYIRRVERDEAMIELIETEAMAFLAELDAREAELRERIL